MKTNPPHVEESTSDVKASDDYIDIDRVIAQINELANTQLHSRAQQLRQQIQQQIDALLDEEPDTEAGFPQTIGTLNAANR